MKSLVKWNSTGNDRMFPQFPSLFDDFVTKDLFSIPFITGGTVPAVNVKETETAYELEMAAPGMEKKDFKVELDQNTLTISVEKENRSEENSENGNYSRREFSYRSFSRSFNLSEELVKAEEISANYKNGILHLVVPKKEASKPRVTKTISIT